MIPYQLQLKLLITAILFFSLNFVIAQWNDYDWKASGTENNQLYGEAISNAGDVNGDGYDDLIVGNAWFYNGAITQGGKVDVFYGSPTGLPDEPSLTIIGEESFDEFGYSVGGGGDVNGDGFDDVIV